MTAKLPRPVQDLIDAFTRLPGIGPKMAARLTFYLLQLPPAQVGRFIDALDGIRQGLRNCTQCGHISEGELCAICTDQSRNQRQVCVVEGSLDVIAIEKTGVYTGMYHVLGGVLSPIDGIGPDQLRVRLLETRVATLAEEPTGEAANRTVELILATNPSLEGEATAQYLSQRFAPQVESGQLVLSRIARGLPMGSDLEYADPSTLSRALEGRKHI